MHSDFVQPHKTILGKPVYSTKVDELQQRVTVVHSGKLYA